jgi:hypothetical protein
VLDGDRPRRASIDTAEWFKPPCKKTGKKKCLLADADTERVVQQVASSDVVQDL